MNSDDRLLTPLSITFMFVATLSLAGSRAMNAQQGGLVAPDSRLAEVRRALISVESDLDAARPVAACFTDHLKAMTPLTAVDKKEDADVVLLFHATGPTVWLTALLPDGDIGGAFEGTRLWFRKIEQNPRYIGGDLACKTADALATQLLSAMRRAKGTGAR